MRWNTVVDRDSRGPVAQKTVISLGLAVTEVQPHVSKICSGTGQDLETWASVLRR